MGHPLAALPSAGSSPADAQGHLETLTRQLDCWEITGKGASAALAERVRQLSAQVSDMPSVTVQSLWRDCKAHPAWSQVQRAHASSSPFNADLA